MKKVKKIEVPDKQAESRKLKVAAYCRVSTKYKSQKSTGFYSGKGSDFTY
jgi:hypothetical protein